MLNEFSAITTNTFAETLRQPIFGVIVAATLVALILAPSLVMFTLDDDNLLLQDIGLSTLLVAGLLLGVFAAAGTITQEIENKTALTVLSKTIGRARFLLGKFCGIAAAVLLAEFLFALALLMVVRHGVMETASDELDPVVITLGALALGLSLLIGLAGNYLYQWRFTSTAILSLTALATLAVALLSFLDPHWQYTEKNLLAWNLLPLILLTVMAALILTAIAVLAATRFNVVLTLVTCSIVFLLGSMVDPWLGPIAREGSGLARLAAWIPLAILPNINFFVVANVIYRQSSLPLEYLGQAAIYALLYVGACLLFAIGLFRSRELG